jgi:hypothetical protein
MLKVEFVRRNENNIAHMYIAKSLSSPRRKKCSLAKIPHFYNPAPRLTARRELHSVHHFLGLSLSMRRSTDHPPCSRYYTFPLDIAPESHPIRHIFVQNGPLCDRLEPSRYSVPRWNPRYFFGIPGIAGNFSNTALLNI